MGVHTRDAREQPSTRGATSEWTNGDRDFLAFHGEVWEPLAPLSHPDQDAKHPVKISAPSVVRDAGSAGLAVPLTTALFSGVELKPFETEASPSFRKIPNRFAHVPFYR